MAGPEDDPLNQRDPWAFLCQEVLEGRERCPEQCQQCADEQERRARSFGLLPRLVM